MIVKKIISSLTGTFTNGQLVFSPALRHLRWETRRGGTARRDAIQLGKTGQEAMAVASAPKTHHSRPASCDWSRWREVKPVTEPHSLLLPPPCVCVCRWREVKPVTEPHSLILPPPARPLVLIEDGCWRGATLTQAGYNTHSPFFSMPSPGSSQTCIHSLHTHPPLPPLPPGPLFMLGGVGGGGRGRGRGACLVPLSGDYMDSWSPD